MHYPSTINHNDHGGHTMITDYDDYDVLETLEILADDDIMSALAEADDDIDRGDLAEMIEDFGLGFPVISLYTEYEFDADNPEY